MIPEDVWFILPEKKIRGMWSVGLYPKLASAKYREYQEAWHLLRGESPAVITRIHACAEEWAGEVESKAKANFKGGGPECPLHTKKCVRCRSWQYSFDIQAEERNRA